MKVVITGAAGYVGSALTVLLAMKGHHVVAVDNDKRRLHCLAAFPFPRDNVEFHSCSLEELIRRLELLSDGHAVVHLAGISSDSAAEQAPELTRRVNVDLAVELAQAAKSVGTTKFLLASTIAIYQVPVGHRLEHEIFREDDQPPLGTPIGVYAQSKLAAEQALTSLSNADFTVIMLRKGSLYGYSPIMRWDLVINRMTLNAWKRQSVLLHDLGAVWRPIAHVEDAASAYLHLVELPPWRTNGLAFNLLERNARLSEVCLETDDVLRHMLGRGIELRHGTSPLTQRTGRVSGESLRRAGWRPRRFLREGLAELLRKLETRDIDLPEVLAQETQVEQPSGLYQMINQTTQSGD